MSAYLEKLFSLENKVALITGAAGGIGRALAEALYHAGAHVALSDINTDALAEIKEGLGDRASVFKLDMVDFDSFDAVVEGVSKISGRIDILVNCAGINKREGFVDVEESTYDKIMNINLKGAFFLSQAVAPYMKAQQGGSIINIGSHTTGAALGGVSVYGASKSGLMSLTRSMAVEWAKYNVRANCLSPGHIKTELTVPTWAHPERSKYLLDRIALNRPGFPEDLIGLIILLASDASSYISGQEFRIDGGFLAGGQPWPYDTKF
ncbi:MAG: glucose 1-dehydrogenase [Defluviitaleaceae bacterium]|nr:glucose 1-dehydrogenase [Defluviitaleaceae bacterium]